MSSLHLYPGDCLAVLPTFPVNTFDALITDPPASIGFMGQVWDGDKGGRRQWVAWLSSIMRECLRVLKPGAHALVWAIPRRSHWTAWALEDAGFEIRDCIHRYFLSGFPKSLNVGLAVDAKLQVGKSNSRSLKVANDSREGEGRYIQSGRNNGILGDVTGPRLLKETPTTDQAKQWNGWGTLLKPAIEHWWLVRKPLSEKTVAENVLKWGTGALNIGDCRIPVHQKKDTWHNDQMAEPGTFAGRNKRPAPKVPMQEWVEGFPGWHEAKAPPHKRMSGFKTEPNRPRPTDPHPDSRYPSHFIVSDWLLGDHSGFFHPPIYCPKPKTKERDKGLENMPHGAPVRWNKGGVWTNATTPARNHHPTVKPVELMKYFCKLLTRPGGHVLDPFAGSFTTGVACQQLGLVFTGIEMKPDYFQIGLRRLGAA